MEIKFIEKNIKYDGTQILPLWTYNNFGILGDSIVAFIGECDVRTDRMVDVEDRIDGNYIYSSLMLHFIVEFFPSNIMSAVLLQRLFISMINDYLNDYGVKREGDDLFYKDGKLSVSIATVSAISSKIHIGINIETKGAPVKAAGLQDMKIDPVKMGNDLLLLFKNEFDSVLKATKKVLPI